MSESPVEQLIRRIHAAPVRVVLAASGGGSCAIADLLAVAGASRTLLEAVVPYSTAAMVDLLGGTPDRFCSSSTARAMAMAALERGLRYDPAATDALAGIGCAAGLASDRSKRGTHRVHVAAQTARVTESWSLVLTKGTRTRAAEERLCGDLILRALAQIASLDDAVRVATLPGEQIIHHRRSAPDAWTELILGRCQVVPTGPLLATTATPVIFPGAFHPLHDGHRTMARLAREMLGQPVAFELSIVNVDKPPLDFLEIADRLEGLAGQPVWLTRAATFAIKARLFPGATFVVGADTMQRIADPRYYHHNPAEVTNAIDVLRAQNCRFLVFGRLIDGTFCTLADLPLPARLREICRGVAAAQFCDARSSSAIRLGDPGP